MNQRIRVLAVLSVIMMLLTVGSVAAGSARPDSACRNCPAGEDRTTATVTLAPMKDNTLYEITAGTISNGAGQYLFAGKTQRGELRRALLAFDLREIPPWATVTSAIVTLTMSKTIAGETPVTLHRATAAWGEGGSDAQGDEGAGAAAQPGDATWRYTFFDTAEWTTLGGDFEATPQATTSVGGLGTYDWSSPALLAGVQAWVADPASNFGWVVLGDESAPTTAKRFDSRESAPENRPLLTITYEAAEARLAFVPVVAGE